MASTKLKSPPRRADLTAVIGESRPLQARLKRIAEGKPPVWFEHITPAAQPLLAGLIASRQERRTWVLCKTQREQEQLHNELLNWHPNALLLPSVELAAIEGAVPDPEVTAERLGILQKLAAGSEASLIVLCHDALEDEVPSPGGLGNVTIRLARNKPLDREQLLTSLAGAGYESVPQVSLRGQFAVRGGIIDVFSWHHPLPVRIELFGDEIDSIREFDLDVQTSIRHLDHCTLLLGDPEGNVCRVREYIRPGDVVVTTSAVSEGYLPDEDAAPVVRTGAIHVHLFEAGLPGAEAEDFSAAFFDHGLGEFEAGDLVIAEAKRTRLFSQIEEWKRADWRLFIVCNNEGEQERLCELLESAHLGEYPQFVIGTLAHGFTHPAARVAVLSDSELFGRYRQIIPRRVARQMARESGHAQIDFSELNEDDLVVHLEHGIGRYHGLQTFTTGDKEEEVLVLEFDGDARLYVPLEQSFLVSRYVGVGKRNPQLSALGDGAWSKAKSKAERAVFDYAAKLLDVHAERETSVGYAFPPDSKWQEEFEASFLFTPTPDQVKAIAETKMDMESERPMDRLICGDVGFGKTEVAIRAAFKTVMSGKQVAILVPTTVLAQQHYRNFRERMSDYPVTVEMLSRFRTHSEQRAVVKQLAEGGVDIVVGTHRLISGDVSFKNLGLVVIDEEQRFGVRHKERFKEMFKLVDVLTLSATPIPRTLYLSLMGAKDMSLIETPPPNRVPVETTICGYDERIIRDAINREISRQGQVYFLHNRVQSIENVAKRIQNLCPKARIAIGHGQMEEDDLEQIMQRFVNGEADVLVSTTIIESGLDIPNANTIVIDRADRFGLADLYQLRGRVGRSNHKAYAYLMLPRELMTVGAARKRINAIKQYGSLGAGFKIAMRDLEIRGAGNILGTAQSGHIIAIGFDLYCQLLKQAVAKLKGEKVRPRLDIPVRIDFAVTNEGDYALRPTGGDGVAPAFLPAAYLTEAQVRIHAYRDLAQVTTQQQIDQLRKTWRDRFGPLPQAATNLLTLTEIKLAGVSRKVTRVEVKENKLMLTRGGDFMLVGGKFPRLTEPDPTERLAEIVRLIKSL